MRALHESVDHIFLTLHPIVGAKQRRHLGTGEGVDKRLAGSKRFFQIHQRESGINGEEGPFRIGGLQHGVGAAGFPETITENREQRLDVAATRYPQRPVQARHLAQLSGLFRVIH